MPAELKQWSVLADTPDVTSLVLRGVFNHKAPWNSGICIFGYVYNHPNKDKITTAMVDGHRILTSRVIRIAGRDVITQNNIYELKGLPNRDYIIWFKDHYPDIALLTHEDKEYLNRLWIQRSML